jgi:hypothetical protein
MKNKITKKTLVLLIGALCSAAAYSAPRGDDFIINCKVFTERPSDGKDYFLRSTATATQSGGLRLTTDSSRATTFAFIRKDSYSHDANGTTFLVLPRGQGKCAGFANSTYVKHRAAVQVGGCESFGIRGMSIDNISTSDDSKFAIRVRSNLEMYWNVDHFAEDASVILYDTTGGPGSNQTFYTRGCRNASNGRFRPRGGT